MLHPTNGKAPLLDHTNYVDRKMVGLINRYKFQYITSNLLVWKFFKVRKKLDPGYLSLVQCGFRFFLLVANEFDQIIDPFRASGEKERGQDHVQPGTAGDTLWIQDAIE